MDGRLAELLLRISGLIKRYFLPGDSEVSFNYLRYIYQVAEINDNRVLVNKISSIRADKMVEVSKLVHVYKFESKYSLAPYRFFLNRPNGQI